MYIDFGSRTCKAKDERQEHIPERCNSIHTYDSIKIKKEDIFSDNTIQLKVTLYKLQYDIT